MDKVKVIFRKDKNTGEIIAFFPETLSSYGITIYCHIGQHSTAVIDYYLTDTAKATKEEYQDLYNELTNLVEYNLEIKERMSYKRGACLA